MPKNLLVADDSVVIQKSVGITFAQEDYSITYASNGADAITKAKQVKPDVILVDVVMPMKSGYDVCDAVKKDPELAKASVILMAGTHEPYDEAKGKSVGADGYIIKPFESQALIDRVHELLKPRPAAATPPAPSAPTPSPASTIAAQAPRQREAPVLDMDVSPPEATPAQRGENSFEFSLDDFAPSDVSTPSFETAPAQESETLPKGDFWDFTSAEPDSSNETTSVEPAPAFDFSAAEPDANYGTIAAGQYEPPPAPAGTEEFSFDPQPVESSEIPEAQVELSVEPMAAETTSTPIQLSEAQMEAIVTKVFQKVIERIAWEVVPDLAETIIKEELARLTKDKS